MVHARTRLELGDVVNRIVIRSKIDPMMVFSLCGMLQSNHFFGRNFINRVNWSKSLYNAELICAYMYQYKATE